MLSLAALILLLFLIPTVNSSSSEGFSLGIRDSIMIAHSFNGEEFGPAQGMHGATYTVDVDFCAPELVDKCNWVVDIGKASELLQEVLAKYNMKNLNDLFPEENTTTEFMCREIHQQLCARLKGEDFQGGLTVKL
jgi:6-pyruvoyltetrahydropterin/6-carboxytetrahydropterin synthase